MPIKYKWSRFFCAYGSHRDFRIEQGLLGGVWRKRPFRALHQLFLQIERGEVFGFLGANGAGKTTTLKLLTGLIFPTEGTATILGHPVGEPETFLHLGYLPEQPYFYDYLTAEELLGYFARFFPLPLANRTLPETFQNLPHEPKTEKDAARAVWQAPRRSHAGFPAQNQAPVERRLRSGQARL